MVKPKVIFTFVEAGLGHIVPATAVSEAFTKKYGIIPMLSKDSRFR